MIRINLLPEEYRRRARTPIRLMVAVSLAVAVNSSLLAYWGWMTFGVAAEIRTEHNVLQLEMDGLTPQVNYHNALNDEMKFHASRETTLAEININRVLWTQKFDELVDLVNLGGDGVRHYIWFDDLTVKQEAGGRNNNYGSLKAGGHSGSPKWDQVANFLEDVEDKSISSFIDTFSPPASPEGTQNPKDEDLVPSEVWSFPLSLNLKSAEDRQTIKQEEESK
jgi:hypothetical protein